MPHPSKEPKQTDSFPADGLEAVEKLLKESLSASSKQNKSLSQKEIERILQQLEFHRQELERTKEEAESFFEQHLGMHMVADLDGTIERVNSACEEMLGYNVAELKNTNFQELIHPDDLADTREQMEKLEQGQDVLNFENRYRHKNGGWRVLRWSATVAREEKLIYATAHDVTETFEAQNRLELTIRGANIGTWDWNIQTGLVSFNNRWCEMLGYSLDEVEPNISTWEKLIHPDDQAAAEALLQEHLNGSTKFYESEHRLRHKDGHWVWVHDCGQVIERDENGRALRACGTHRDITERKERNLEQKREKEFLQSTLDGLMAHIALLDAEGTILLVNESWREFAEHNGLDPESCGPGASYIDAGNPESDNPQISEFSTNLEHIIKENIDSFSMEYPCATEEKDYWFNVTVSRLKNDPLNRIAVFHTDITERRAMQEMLRIQNEELKTSRLAALNMMEDAIAAKERLEITQFTLDHSSDSVFWFAPDGSLLYVNDETCKKLGYNRDELLNLCIYDISGMAPGKWPDFWEEISREKNKTFESINRSKDGTVIPVEINASFMDFEGTEYICAYAHDITDRKTREEKLLKLSNEQSLILNSSTFGIALVRNRIFEWINPRLAEMLRLPLNGIEGQSTRIMYPSEEAYLTLGESYNQLGRGERYEQTVQFTDAGGSLFWCRLTGSAIDPAHPQDGSIWMFEDVTARKQAEQALIDSEARLRRAQQIAKVGDWEFDLKAGTVTTSQSAREIYGLPDRETTIADVQKIPLSQDRPMLDSALNDLIEIGRPYDVEFTICRPADQALVEIHSTAEYDPDTETVFGVIQDITQRKRSEAELRRLSTAIDQSPETIVITDTEGVIQYVNPAFTKITGYTKEEALGNTPRVLKSGKHDDSFYADMWNTVLAGEIWTGRIINKKKDGSLYTEEASFAPVKNREGDITNFVAIKRDITEEIEKEELYRQSQKMESVGQLAGGVAHDFNNILQAIIGFSEILLESLPAESPEHQHSLQIEQAARRAAELTQQLLAFSRKEHVELKKVDANEVIQNSTVMIKSLLGSKNELNLDLDEKIPPIVADAGQLIQIIMNLGVNARDAMPQGGTLQIASRVASIDEKNTSTNQNTANGDYVCISVSDTGTGITERVKERLFEPFFTTKEVGKGTGLGLAVVYGILQQHKGWIDVESSLGKGTTFYLYFPVWSEAIQETSSRSKHRILVVESDPDLSISINQTLCHANYDVLVVQSAEEALIEIKKSPSFDLLLVEKELPDQPDAQWTEALQEEKNIPLIVLGDENNTARLNPDIDDKYKTLIKPFTAIELLSTIVSELS